MAIGAGAMIGTSYYNDGCAPRDGLPAGGPRSWRLSTPADGTFSRGWGCISGFVFLWGNARVGQNGIAWLAKRHCL